MIPRLTESEHQEQYQQQLQNNATRAVSEFLSKPEYDDVRREYELHFDAIKAAIDNPRTTLRTCSEDIMRLSPIIFEKMSNERLFFKDLHRAIKEGFLRKEDF